MGRKNKCRRCIWATRLSELQTFCPFKDCVKKGVGRHGCAETGTADRKVDAGSAGSSQAAPEPDVEPVG